MIGTSVDGAFGRKSVIALQKWINAKVYPTVKPKAAASAVKKAAPAKTSNPAIHTDRDKKINAMCDWTTKTAKSGKYKYKKWKNKKPNTHKCPICHPGSGNGWNCTGFAFMGLNGTGEELYRRCLEKPIQ